MKTVAIIQARMGSSRLPGKVMMPLAGQPVIRHVVDRVAAAHVFDDIVVATTDRPLDDDLAALASGIGATVVRGSEDDVLGRFGKAAAVVKADAIVRVTADCPLIDPAVLSAMAAMFHNAQGGKTDVVTNARVRTYPRGLDAEMFTRDALDEMLMGANSPHQREHVTPYLYEHDERFAIRDLLHGEDLSDLRWTLDTPEDFEFLTRIFDGAGPGDGPSLPDVLELLAANPDWRAINAHVQQKHV